MKFKNGDRVVVIKVEPEYGKCLGHIGKVVDVDPEWEFPYEVELEDVLLRGEQEVGQMQELFAEDEIELESVVEAKTVVANTSYYVNIKWQEGTIEENGVNGTQIEDVIDILVARLQGFQQGGFPCRENALAITHLQEAQNWLYRRTMVRKKQGIEGQYKNHV